MVFCQARRCFYWNYPIETPTVQRERWDCEGTERSYANHVNGHRENGYSEDAARWKKREKARGNGGNYPCHFWRLSAHALPALTLHQRFSLRYRCLNAHAPPAWFSLWHSIANRRGVCAKSWHLFFREVSPAATSPNLKHEWIINTFYTRASHSN